MSNIQFHSDFHQNVKMIELSEELAQSIMEGDKLYLKGNNVLPAVLCTNDKTYELKQVESSNMLLLVSPMLEKGNLPTDTTVMAIMRSHIEISPIQPEFSALRELLTKHTIRNESELSNGISLIELCSKIQSSEVELLVALEEFSAFEYNNKWVCLHDQYLFEILDEVVTFIRAGGYSYDEIPKETMEEDLLQSFTNTIINQIEKEYFIVKNKTTCSFQTEKFSLFAACQILQKKEKYALSEFQKKWKEIVDEIGINMDLLKGYGLVDKNTISWFPANLLPKEPEKRFALLFKKLTTWTQNQIFPYLEDLGTSKEQLLLKWTLCTQKGEQKLYSEKK